MPKNSTAALCLLAACAPGCVYFTSGYAQERKFGQGGGVIALHGKRVSAQAEAEKLMAERCAGPYHIVSEEDAVIGVLPGLMGGTQTELRLTYKCGGAPPVPCLTPAPATP